VADHAGGREQASLTWRNLIESAKEQLRLEHGRRVRNLIESDVALYTVVGDAEASANDRLAIAAQIVGGAQPRPPLRTATLVSTPGVAFAGLSDPVGDVAAPHYNRADKV